MNYDDEQAEICYREKGKRGWVGPLAIIPLNEYEEETDEEDARLIPESDTARRVLLFLSASKMLHVLRGVEERLAVHEADESACGDEWIKDMDTLREVRKVIEQATDASYLYRYRRKW